MSTIDIGKALRNGEGLPNQGVHEAMARAGWAGAVALVRTLGELEALLTLLGRVLAMTQPPINGKFDVQWWVPRGKAPWRDPVLVRWRKLRSGRKRAYAVKSLQKKMIRRAGKSKLCATETLGLCQTAVGLIAAYKQTRAALIALEARAKVPAKVRDFLLEARVAVALDHQSARDTLVAAGYEIDAERMRLTEDLR